MKIDPTLTTLDPTQAAAQRTAKLTDGAHQFEAMMLEQMLKPLKFGAAPGSGSDDDTNDSAADTVAGFGSEALARSIASHGGFGIAQQVIRQVTRQDQARGSAGKEAKVV